MLLDDILSTSNQANILENSRFAQSRGALNS